MKDVPELMKEDVIPFYENKRLPGSPTQAQLRNWRDLGIYVGGMRVRLETFRIGARSHTTRQAYERFLVAINAEKDEK
jgi:hypothetical protein